MLVAITSFWISLLKTRNRKVYVLVLSSLYPSSWTHRRYFQQREKRVPAAVTLPGGRARVQSAGGAARSEPLQEQEPRGQEQGLASEQQEPRAEEARGQGQEEPAVFL